MDKLRFVGLDVHKDSISVIGHELARRLEPAEIADRRHEDHRRDHVETAHRTQRFHQRRHRPLRQHRHDPAFEMVAAVLRGPDRFEIILEDDLMRLLLEGLEPQPLPVPDRPVLPVGAVDAAMAQQESEALLPRPGELRRRVHAGADQIADRLMHRVRHPHRRQVTSTMLQRQLLGIAPVVLDPVAWLARDQARRRHQAAMPQVSQLSINAVAAAAGFVAEIQPMAVLAEPLRHLRDIGRRVGKGADKTNITIAPFIGGRLGLVPSEHSSGNSVRRGGITKAGSGEARRMLVEAAWSYRYPPRIASEKILTVAQQPKPVRDIAWKAQLRLCDRYRKLSATGKRPTVVVTAIARELCGFIWAIGREVVPVPS